MDGLIVSTLFIFAAELGDKSQLLALALTGRYNPGPVLLGVALATGVNHALSILIGHFVGTALPPHILSLVVGSAFIVFGAWTLRGDSLEDRPYEREGLAIVLLSFVTFFLAELGDKTMLATITLATQYGPLGTWIGSTAGMVAADAVAIFAGGYALARISPQRIRVGAALLFFGYGVWELYRGLDLSFSLLLHEWILISGMTILALVVGWLSWLVASLAHRLAVLEKNQSEHQAD